jgi:D-beta-D-heptose 7-phosphate kinase/D-beta-D-heptose 1-phosphate adenosyltransferase
MTAKTDVPSLIKRFRDCRLLLLGDVMLDEYLWGQVRRICPEAPVPIVEEMRRSSVPGGMANVAVNAAALGAHVVLCGVVGGDPQGEALRAMLGLLGIDSTGLRTDHQRPTITKTRIIAHNQQVVRVDREDTRPISLSLEQELLSLVRERLPSVDVCILSDYAKGVLSHALTSEVIAAARQCGCPVVVDPKGRDYRRYRGASVITPNLSEAALAADDGATSVTGLAGAGNRLTELLPGTAVLVTRGPEGLTLFRETAPPLSIPSAARHVYDVTGAGDTLVATLAVAIATGCPLELAAALANCGAGVVVGKVGTATVSTTELLAAIDGVDLGLSEISAAAPEAIHGTSFHDLV